MSNSSVTRTRISGKTIYAAMVECVIIISFYLLFFSNIDFDSSRGLTTFLFIVYPFVISICTGIVTAFIAETKLLVGWKWGGMASAMTLFLIIMMVTLPSMVSGMALIIAPPIAIAISFNLMNSVETNREQ